MAEESDSVTEPSETQPTVRPRSPLIIGAIAYGILIWMVMVVCLLIAWKLSTQ